jgi:LysM repeat protein
MSQLHHLSATGIFSPLAKRPAGYPKQIAGQPCVYLKKDLIHCGHYTHPAKGFNVPVDRKRIDDWVSNFRKMRANGVKVPINLDHSDRAADCVGYVVEMSRSGDALHALCQFIGSDAAAVAARNYVSVGIDPAYTDGQERDYGDAIVHVALTPVPIVPDQAPFTLAASTSASSAPVMAAAANSEAPGNNVIPMYKLTCSESTLRGLYRHVPGMEQAPHDQKIPCLVRHLQMIARLDEKYGLAPSRTDLAFDPTQARDWRGRWTAVGVAGTPGSSAGLKGTGNPGNKAIAPATTAPATQPAIKDEYEVVSGDTLSSIAKKLTGDAQNSTLLPTIHPGQRNRLDVGDKIRLPEAFKQKMRDFQAQTAAAQPAAGKPQNDANNNVAPNGAGTILDKDVAGIVYGETSSLRPALKNPTAGAAVSNYDAESEQKLQDAREKIAEIARKTGGGRVANPATPTKEELKNDDVRRAWESAQKAATDSKEKDCGTSDHFVLWPSNDGGKTPVADPKIPQDWPYSQKDKITQSYGPFRNRGGGDTPKGDNTYVFIYKDVK